MEITTHFLKCIKLILPFIIRHNSIRIRHIFLMLKMRNGWTRNKKKTFINNLPQVLKVLSLVSYSFFTTNSFHNKKGTIYDKSCHKNKQGHTYINTDWHLIILQERSGKKICFLHHGYTLIWNNSNIF